MSSWGEMIAGRTLERNNIARKHRIERRAIMITLTGMEMITVDQNVMTETDRWSSFMGRDAAFDGTFVAAVTSTGIYCRPSCPARRP